MNAYLAGDLVRTMAYVPPQWGKLEKARVATMHTADEMRQLLEADFARYEGPPPSVEEFIDPSAILIASRYDLGDIRCRVDVEDRALKDVMEAGDLLVMAADKGAEIRGRKLGKRVLLIFGRVDGEWKVKALE
ncbi:MAG: hypothetical protein C4523_13585 [Myxococcales bacterium]|nr:MAG: hypothetical protein C4523_13585 [Myxococcales bacterium]